MKKRILVTSALPYANGSIHLGHLVEYIQTDIWVRFQKLAGHETYYFCADDTHGTPIMIAAKNKGISPEELINQVQKEHIKDFNSFQIEFTNFHSTNSPENKELADEIFLKLTAGGHIYQKEIKQAYCLVDKMFLPDRFIIGECPKCGKQDQYGDSCDSCGSTYTPLDLKNAKCSLCGNPPTQKKSKHYFFRLNDFEKELKEWFKDKEHVSAGVVRKMDEWFRQGLNDWDISRDGPYFGFKIPGEEDKYYYVWLDAPIGYMASAKNYFEKQNKKDYFDKFWRQQNDWKIYHFIGKDIMYFHTLFWPAELIGAGFKTPSGVFIHGFLTVNGEKMSKSKGTFILADVYRRYLDPSYLRFYYASKLSDSMDDIDLNFQDFKFKINSDLVGNFINIFSRIGGNIAKKLDYRLTRVNEEGKELIRNILSKKEKILSFYEMRKFSHAIREILTIGDMINKYINDKEPWNLIKKEKKDIEQAKIVATTSLNCAKIMAGLLKPVLPEIVTEIENFLQIEPLNFSNLDKILENHKILPYRHLIERIDDKKVNKMLADSKESLPGAPASVSFIGVDQLKKVDLRIGEILEASLVTGADKLLQLKINLGGLGTKNVFAGIKASYDPRELIGKKCVVVANLLPRKMKFGLSEAMILATGEGENLSLVIPDKNATAGDSLK